MRPSLAASRNETGQIKVTLSGQTNLLYVLEGSTNLTQWRKAAVRTNLTGWVEFIDRTGTNAARRFYRAFVP